MNKNYLKAFRAKKENSSTLRSAKFFTGNNVDGTISIPDFQGYINSSSDSELDHLDTLFESVSNGANINNILKPSFDKDHGHQIIWFKVKMPKSDLSPLRIHYNEQIMRFFQKYQRGDIKFQINLKELMIEAGFEITED